AAAPRGGCSSPNEITWGGRANGNNCATPPRTPLVAPYTAGGPVHRRRMTIRPLDLSRLLQSSLGLAPGIDPVVPAVEIGGVALVGATALVEPALGRS